MFRLNFVEFACIVAIGVAMVELPAGHRFFRLPEILSAPATSASGTGAGARASASHAGASSRAAEGHR